MKRTMLTTLVLVMVAPTSALAQSKHTMTMGSEPLGPVALTGYGADWESGSLEPDAFLLNGAVHEIRGLYAYQYGSDWYVRFAIAPALPDNAPVSLAVAGVDYGNIHRAPWTVAAPNPFDPDRTQLFTRTGTDPGWSAGATVTVAVNGVEPLMPAPVLPLAGLLALAVLLALGAARQRAKPNA